MNEGAIEVSSGVRRAALTLHALAEADRDWLLEQLPTKDSETLRRLLAELDALGIPADSEVIRCALAETPSKPSLSDAQAYAGVLAREPEAFRGPLLSLLSPEDREAVLAHWPLALEARPPLVAQPAWTPRLRDTLLKSWRTLAAVPEAQR